MIPNTGWRLLLCLLAGLAAAQQVSKTAAEFFNLAKLHSSYGQYPEAESALNQALRICEEAADDVMTVRAWNALGELPPDAGPLPRSRVCLH